MISQKCQSNFSVCYLNMRSNDIQIEYCVIAELASSCKGELISAPQHCSEASGLLPKSTGDVLWGERGRKSDKIDRSRWETPPPDGEKQPLPRPEWEKCSRQMCRNCPTHTHFWMHPAKLLRDMDENASAGHPSIIKQAGDKGGEMRMVGGIGE